MQEIFKASVFFRALTAFFTWFGVKWHESRIVTWFLSPSAGRNKFQSSVITKFWRFFHRGLCTVFNKLHLTKLFEGSIFKQTFLWCLLPAALAPVLDTKIILCLAAIGIFSLAVRFGCGEKLHVPSSPVHTYIGLFAFVFLIATLTSVTIQGSLFTGLLTFFVAIFALVFSSAVSSKRQIDFAVKIFVAVGAGVSLYGIYQFFFYDPASAGAWIDNDMFSDITHRVYSTLENPNVLGEYLLLIMPFTAAGLLNGKTWPQRLFYLGCLALMLVCMLFTSSRGAWLGLLFATAIFVVMLDARFILVGIIGLVVLYFALPAWVIERFASIGDMSDSSTSYRVYIWLATIAMLKDYWFSGIGPGTDAFNLVYPAYSFNTIKAPHAHNLYLQLMCDAGILGLLLFLLILFSYYRTVFSAFSRERDRKTKHYLAAAAASVGGFLLQGMTDYAFYNNRVTLFFWVIIALGIVLSRRSEMEEGHFLWSES